MLATIERGHPRHRRHPSLFFKGLSGVLLVFWVPSESLSLAGALVGALATRADLPKRPISWAGCPGGAGSRAKPPASFDALLKEEDHKTRHQSSACCGCPHSKAAERAR